MTPAGIEPATFRFVAQHMNHCATAVPLNTNVISKIPWLQQNKRTDISEDANCSILKLPLLSTQQVGFRNYKSENISTKMEALEFYK